MALVTPVLNGNDGSFTATFPGGTLILNPVKDLSWGDLEYGNDNHWLGGLIDRSVLSPTLDYNYDFAVKCRVTYSYVDPEVDTQGDYSDHGWMLPTDPGDVLMTDYDLRLPSMLSVFMIEYSIPLNGADKITRDAMMTTFNESEIRTLCECRYVTDTSGKGLDYEEVIAFLLAEDTGHDWIILTGEGSEAEINLHRHI